MKNELIFWMVWVKRNLPGGRPALIFWWGVEKEPAWRQTGADDTDWADWRGFFGMVW